MRGTGSSRLGAAVDPVLAVPPAAPLAVPPGVAPGYGGGAALGARDDISADMGRFHASSIDGSGLRLKIT